MNTIKAIMLEEDMFPKTFTNFEEKDFGILFYNEHNKESYDSNHALIYKNKIKDLGLALDLITDFYANINIKPNIYQAVEDEGYFKENENVFNEHGYSVWIEGPNKFMLLTAENNIKISNQLDIKIITEWDDRIATDICIPSNESYEIEVIKNSITDKSHRVFIGYAGNKAVAITYFHISEYDCCRFDYILISKDSRKNGYARELISYEIDFCRENNIKNCFQWPANKTSEKICYEVGFRHLFSAEAGRASYKARRD
jgi:hypothetical protein